VVVKPTFMLFAALANLGLEVDLRQRGGRLAQVGQYAWRRRPMDEAAHAAMAPVVKVAR
jgi:hypothetical protein